MTTWGRDFTRLETRVTRHLNNLRAEVATLEHRCAVLERAVLELHQEFKGSPLLPLSPGGGDGDGESASLTVPSP